jgi:recombinational DNA repair protein (RecF pathway)
VAKRARRPKSPFGAGLERLSHVRVAYFQRETRELVNLPAAAGRITANKERTLL